MTSLAGSAVGGARPLKAKGQDWDPDLAKEATTNSLAEHRRSTTQIIEHLICTRGRAEGTRCVGQQGSQSTTKERGVQCRAQAASPKVGESSPPKALKATGGGLAMGKGQAGRGNDKRKGKGLGRAPTVGKKAKGHEGVGDGGSATPTEVEERR